MSRHRNFVKKCDAEITRLFSGQPCKKCGARLGTVGHHLIPRSHLATRHDIRLIFPLCPEHHMHSNVLAAHSTNPEAQDAFDKWLEEEFPETWKLMLDKRNEICYAFSIDWEKRLSDLRAINNL